MQFYQKKKKKSEKGGGEPSANLTSDKQRSTSLLILFKPHFATAAEHMPKLTKINEWHFSPPLHTLIESKSKTIPGKEKI